MTTTKDGLGIEEVTAGKVVQALTMEDVPKGTEGVAEIPKSPCMPRPKKDKQVMAPIRVSLRNPLRKLLMEEKRKVIAIETGEEEEDF